MSHPTLRSPERLRHHFEVERELASRLRRSTREERTALFQTLYGELFERVPDHPRLTRRESPEQSRAKVQAQLRLLRPFLGPDKVLLEVAPGDCRLSYAAAALCGRVVGADISDQRAAGEVPPPNFRLVVYDGYQLDLPEHGADVAFSYQFLEHLHPDDVDLHFQMIRRLLRPGGWYVLDTPHRVSGPHDISRHFGRDLVCFHFQEWTYRDMLGLLERHGFGGFRFFRAGRFRTGWSARAATLGAEAAVAACPAGLRDRLAGRWFPSVTLAAQAAG